MDAIDPLAFAANASHFWSYKILVDDAVNYATLRLQPATQPIGEFMQITFDPLVPAEVEAVCQFINRKSDVVRIPMLDGSAIGAKTAIMPGASSGAYVATEPAASTFTPIGAAGGQSAAPLQPGAPLPAAADLFSTAHAVPPAGEASATPVPPPPVPDAPASDVPPAPAAPTNRAENGDLDKDGLPWDARIHSGSKAKNADGTWRSRRGLNDAALVKRVEDELRALMAIPVPNVPAPPTPAPSTPAPPAPPVPALDESAGEAPNVPPPPVPAPVTSPPATAPIPTPPVPPAPIAAGDAAPITFAGLMRKISSGVANKTITPEQVQQALATVQLTQAQMPLLASRADLLPPVDAYIDALLMGGA